MSVNDHAELAAFIESRFVVLDEFAESVNRHGCVLYEKHRRDRTISSRV